MKMSIDDQAVKKLLNNLEDLPEDLWHDAGEYFHDITPRRSGNAQRNTHTTNREIVADYAYAERLDNGWSKQHGGVGMTKPTVDWIQRNLSTYIKKAGG